MLYPFPGLGVVVFCQKVCIGFALQAWTSRTRQTCWFCGRHVWNLDLLCPSLFGSCARTSSTSITLPCQQPAYHCSSRCCRRCCRVYFRLVCPVGGVFHLFPVLALQVRFATIAVMMVGDTRESHPYRHGRHDGLVGRPHYSGQSGSKF